MVITSFPVVWMAKAICILYREIHAITRYYIVTGGIFVKFMNRREQVKLPQFQDRAESVMHQFMQALPVIVFFLDFREILSITWCMASEIQQMFFQVKHKKRQADARRTMESYIYYTDYVLNQIQEMLQLKKEKKSGSIEGIRYKRYIEEEPELSLLMLQYARNLSRLYTFVLLREQEGRQKKEK